MRNHKKGYTLIELILYTAILSSVLTVMIFITRSMYDARARVRTSVLVRENLRFALTQMVANIRGADGVTTPSSASTSSTLELIMNDSAINPTIFSVGNGQVWLAQGSEDAVAITSAEVEVTELSFERSSTDPPFVRITLSGDKRDAAGPYQFPITLTDSATIRRE